MDRARGGRPGRALHEAGPSDERRGARTRDRADQGPPRRRRPPVVPTVFEGSMPLRVPRLGRGSRPVSARRSSPSARGQVPDRVVELVRVRAGDLAENPKNWRRHPERQRAALRGLLREIGYADALLARRDGDRLILVDGHLRKSLSDDQIVPVLVLDLDEREAETLLVTLDPLAALAEADPGALAELLETVETSSAAVLELLDGLRRSAGLPLVPVFGDPDDVPAPPRVPRTRPGDVWLLGDHRLVCGDATDGATLDRAM